MSRFYLGLSFTLLSREKGPFRINLLVGHFVALRWIVWPPQGSESPESTAGLPDEVFASIMDFIAHGLARRS